MKLNPNNLISMLVSCSYFYCDRYKFKSHSLLKMRNVGERFWYRINLCRYKWFTKNWRPCVVAFPAHPYGHP